MSKIPPARALNFFKKVLMVTSGKGGVGKSSISASLAVGLSRKGLQVGLLDLDLFGPSIPRLMGLEGEAATTDADGNIVPLKNYGVKSMSIGFLTPKDGLVAWRGLMVMKAVQQLLWQVKWSEELMDVLVLDMPPGTGDTLITVCQQLRIDGALVLTTPQRLSLNSAEKGLLLLQKMNVPIIGILENMSWLECKTCHERINLFTSHTQELAEKYRLPLLGQLPMVPEDAESMDMGIPLTAKQKDVPHFEPILQNLVKWIETETAAAH